MNIARYSFDGPYDPDKGFTRDFSAVYSIIDNGPKVIDLGQTDNIKGEFTSQV